MKREFEKAPLFDGKPGFQNLPRHLFYPLTPIRTRFRLLGQVGQLSNTHDQFFLDPQTPQNPTQKPFTLTRYHYEKTIGQWWRDETFLGWVLRGLGVQEELVVSFNNSRVQNPRIQLLSINRQNLNPRDKHDFLNLLVPNTVFYKAQTCSSARVVLGSFSIGEFWGNFWVSEFTCIIV